MFEGVEPAMNFKNICELVVPLHLVAVFWEFIAARW